MIGHDIAEAAFRQAAKTAAVEYEFVDMAHRFRQATTTPVGGPPPPIPAR